MDNSKKITSGIAAELARQGHSKTDLAEVLGISRQSVYSRFNGHIPFTTDDLCKIADYLGLSFIGLIDRILK